MQEAARRERVCLRRPDEGTLLRTIRVTDDIAGRSVEVKVYQAARKNQVVAECFGRRGRPCGWDRIVRRLRALWVCRWIEGEF